MREKMQRFMMGRYGVDELAKALNVTALVCLLISMFSVKIPLFHIFYMIGIALMIYNCFRMFSRNVSKRYQENQKFCSIRYRAVVKKDAVKKRLQQRKLYRFYKCPQCSQKVRVPKGRGKICITCPKCKKEFIKRS